MDILILGGTVFVGRGAAEAALARGHRVTLFHRGTKGKGIVPGADEILGDRDGGLDALADRRWNAVIDACGYVPRLVEEACRALATVDRYLFVSTVSVYDEDDSGGIREKTVDQPVGTEEITNETYGPLKVECERAVRATFGGRATIVRPGLVYGPHDPTNRFPYWVDRFLAGGEVLVPDTLDAPLQQIDARDLGRFMVLLLEKDLGGIYDAVGEGSTFGAMIKACQILNLAAVPIYASPEAVEKAEVRLGWDLPLAYPGRSGVMAIEPTAALASGLQRRPLEVTLADTATWLCETATEESPRFGMVREREIAVIESLKAKV